MKYSEGFKEAVVKKVLPPNNRSIALVAKESGISVQSIRNWLSAAKHGTLTKHRSSGGKDLSNKEKFSVVMESKSVALSDRGRWLRERGLHAEHVSLYEQELRDMIEEKEGAEKKAMRELKHENKRLRRELAQKEKALAEMAALYTLKKKAAELWGENEDD